MSSTDDNGSLRIGLTGGIASGKSTVAEFFAELGIVIVDTDVVARQVVEPDQPALAEVAAQFGESVLREDGTLDRAALRAIVFTDEEQRRRLEAILHPRIREESARQAALATSPYHIVVVPLLVGSPMQEEMDRILVVDCDVDTQIGRLLARDTATEEEAMQIISAQATRDQRLAIADDVIFNEGDLYSVKKQVHELHEKYLSLAGDSLAIRRGRDAD